MADATYQPKVYAKQGGEEFVVANGGKITIESGGNLTVDSGATLTINDGALEAPDLALAQGSVLVGNASGKATALSAKTDTAILIGNGTTITSAAISGDATMANTGALTIANSAISVAKCADAVQDLMPYLTVTGVDNTNGTGTFTVQAKDAAGNNLVQYVLMRVWRGAAAYGAPAAATGFVSATGTTVTTVTANADLLVISTDQGAATFTVTDAGAHHVMAIMDGRIYTGTVTVTGP